MKCSLGHRQSQHIKMKHHGTAILSFFGTWYHCTASCHLVPQKYHIILNTMVLLFDSFTVRFAKHVFHCNFRILHTQHMSIIFNIPNSVFHTIWAVEIYDLVVLGSFIKLPIRCLPDWEVYRTPRIWKRAKAQHFIMWEWKLLIYVWTWVCRYGLSTSSWTVYYIICKEIPFLLKVNDDWEGYKHFSLKVLFFDLELNGAI